MNPVKWGVLSTAKIGTQKVIPAMQQGKLCDVVALASRDMGRARDAAEALDIPNVYGTYEELIADPDVEAIYNPLPNHLHAPWTIRAAEAGKHVLCEKPLTLVAPEAQPVIEARDKAGVLIQEAFMVRFHPQWRRAREIVRSGRIGELRSVQGFFSYMNRDPENIRNIREIGGGGVYDIGCYPIVGARYLFEAEPTRAVALLERDPEMETDRLSSAILDFPGGQATFTCSTQLVPYQRIHACGTEGRVEIVIPFNAPPDEPCRILIDDGSKPGGAAAVEETFPVCNQYTLQGDEFSRAIRTGEPLEHPLEDALANMRVIDAVYQSGESGAWETVG